MLNLKQSTMVLRRPVKYNPDKREFVLNESNLSQLMESKGTGAGNSAAGGISASSLSGTGLTGVEDDVFDTRSETSRTES